MMVNDIYSRSEDAGSCPGEEALRHAVASRVGYDPFFVYANRTIVASVTRGRRGFQATVDLIDERGISHGARELHTEGDCADLLDAVALAIAIAIDPKSLSRPPSEESTVVPVPSPPAQPEAEPPPALPASEPVPVVPPRPSFPPERPPATTELSVGATAAAGYAPKPAVGSTLSIGLRWHVFSLALEGRIDAPSSAAAWGGGSVSSWLLLGALSPCVHFERFFGCALLQGGSAQVAGNGVRNEGAESVPWWAAGGRVGVYLPLGGSLLLRFRSDLVANLAPFTLQLNGQRAWNTPPIAGDAGVDLILRFR
jgi:hypothetical protein